MFGIICYSEISTFKNHFFEPIKEVPVDYLIGAMVWVLSGLYIVDLMNRTDKKIPQHAKRWLPEKSFASVLFPVMLAPLFLLFGIFVMADYIKHDNQDDTDEN